MTVCNLQRTYIIHYYFNMHISCVTDGLFMPTKWYNKFLTKIMVRPLTAVDMTTSEVREPRAYTLCHAHSERILIYVRHGTSRVLKVVRIGKCSYLHPTHSFRVCSPPLLYAQAHAYIQSTLAAQTRRPHTQHTLAELVVLPKCVRVYVIM